MSVVGGRWDPVNVCRGCVEAEDRPCDCNGHYYFLNRPDGCSPETQAEPASEA